MTDLADLADMADAAALAAAKEAVRRAAPGYRLPARRRQRALVHAMLARDVAAAAAAQQGRVR